MKPTHRFTPSQIFKSSNFQIFKSILGLVSFLAFSAAFAQSSAPYDIVLKNGRVIDPETGLDAVRNVGIRGGRIAEISANSLNGKEVLDVSNHVVSPGFIDLHAHGQTNKENEYQAHDGVTTALELESGKPELGKWLDSRRDKAMINYGATVAHAWARTEVLYKTGDKSIEQGSPKFNYMPLTADQSKATLGLMETELKAGALGIGVPIGYYPGATREEVFDVYEWSAKQNAMVFSHIREGKALAVQQAIADAAVNGTALHIVHLNSVTRDEIDLALRMVTNAQQQGLNVTTELYPYAASSTDIASALFDEGWRERMGITYSDLMWVATAERLNEQTFNERRKTGGTIVIFNMKPEWIKRGIESPVTVIGSDGMPYSKYAHPRSAGTFSRVLGVYVREMKALSLIDGLKKMTIRPAQRLEPFSPMMRFKGRIQVGADADITVFDPNTIIDKATFDGGLKFSEGIKHVIVNGTFVIKNGATIGNVFPGQAVVGKYKQ
jgi:dihydroorotase-like cyclic amidohydrolase